MTYRQRPRPQYGEYADEAHSAAQEPTPGLPEEPGEAATPGASAAPQTTPGAQPASHAAPPTLPGGHTGGAIPGVPHNLGVSGNPAPQGTSQRAPRHAPQQGAPYQSPPPNGMQPPTYNAPETPATGPGTTGQTPQPYQQQQFTSSGATGGRLADRIITFALLVIGAFGALYTGFLLLQLAPNMHLAASLFGIEHFVAPSSVSTIGTSGAVLMLALYAVTLIFSIQRLRGGKLTFWVPLVAGVVAFILYLTLTLIAYSQSPELVQAMADPEALNTLLEYSATQSQ